ncbi:glutaredoxin-like protein NrdH [Mycobacteroides abscessus]|uniref:glutaredoxin-like protein NrdH n=1 Tax=Mycobacteroides abscessus TaxID=36809 RepID=UPI000C255C6E|nr:glutaredoxin-like protein NrdH [Mycobacteroides abscessus]
MITVYTKPACPQCDATKRCLTKHNVPFTTVDVTANPEARERVLALGYTAAPVVVTADGEHWAGFRPDRLKALADTEEQAA